MSQKRAKEKRKEEKAKQEMIVKMFGMKPKVAEQDKLPILGCPSCKEGDSWHILLDDFMPYSEETVSIVCKKCRYFQEFVVNLKRARGLKPVEEGEEDVVKVSTDKSKSGETNRGAKETHSVEGSSGDQE